MFRSGSENLHAKLTEREKLRTFLGIFDVPKGAQKVSLLPTFYYVYLCISRYRNFDTRYKFRYIVNLKLSMRYYCKCVGQAIAVSRRQVITSSQNQEATPARYDEGRLDYAS